jgi:hypothetical protein
MIMENDEPLQFNEYLYKNIFTIHLILGLRSYLR